MPTRVLLSCGIAAGLFLESLQQIAGGVGHGALDERQRRSVMEPATPWDGGYDRQRRAGYQARIAGKGTVRSATVENNAAATVDAETPMAAHSTAALDRRYVLRRLVTTRPAVPEVIVRSTVPVRRRCNPRSAPIPRDFGE
jgi:hypothetical protein